MAEFAQQAGASSATVLRFVSQLGYKSYPDFQRALREELEERGWSQGELARRLQVSRQTINAVETDKYDPSLPLALRMAKLFAVPVDDLFIDDWLPGE